MLTLPPCEGRKRIIHTHENVYHTILLWVGEIYQISNSTKTSVNKRLFFIMLPLFQTAGISPPFYIVRDGCCFYTVGGCPPV